MAGEPLGEVTVRELLSDGGGVILDSEDDDFWQLYRDFPARAELVVDRSIWLTPVPICRRKRHAELAAGCRSLSYARDWTVIERIRTGALASATGFYATVDDLMAFFTGLLPGETRLLTEDSLRQLRHRAWDVKDVRDAEVGFGLGVLSTASANGT